MSRPVRITGESVERNIKMARELDGKRADLAAFGRENANLVSASNAQTKIEMQRRLTQQQQCRNEAAFEESMRQNTYDRKFRELTSTQNQLLATELDKDTADAERRRREIQKMCEDAPELKELERMLKIAYLNKERAAQYEEKILIATREQERIQAIEDQMEYERIQAIKNDENKKYAKNIMYENQRAVLQKQMNDKQEQINQAKRSIEDERRMVDNIIDNINKEDEAEYRARKDKQARTAEMVRQFEAQRRIDLENARLAAKAEEDRINSYNKAVEARSEGVAAKKAAKREEEERMLKLIVEESERKRLAEEEFNNLRDMLWEEELEAKRAQDAYDRKARAHQMRKEMMDANSAMMVTKEAQRKRDAENEARMLDIMKHKFAEDEARERAEEAERRRSKQQHVALIAVQSNERRQMYEKERADEASAIEEANRREEYRKRVIQEARRRLLEEHADKLAGYMPNKIFENREELEAFGRRG